MALADTFVNPAPLPVKLSAEIVPAAKLPEPSRLTIRFAVFALVAVLAALAEIPSAFGRPHLHGGRGIRQLRRGVFEARVGLSLRAVFVRLGDTLRVQLIGNHDEVQRYLRGL